MIIYKFRIKTYYPILSITFPERELQTELSLSVHKVLNNVLKFSLPEFGHPAWFAVLSSHK